jgi:hypothetical protein
MLGKSEVLLAAETKDPNEREDLRLSAISAFRHTLEFDSDNQEAKRYLDRLMAAKPASPDKNYAPESK